MDNQQYLIWRVPQDLHRQLNQRLSSAPKLRRDFKEWMREIGDWDKELYPGFNFGALEELGSDLSLMRLSRRAAQSPYIVFVEVQPGADINALRTMMVEQFHKYVGLTIDPTETEIGTIDFS